jgi:hypothetical protein
MLKRTYSVMAVMVLAATFARAEIRHVELSIFGMD